MKITRSQLRSLIREALDDEGWDEWDDESPASEILQVQAIDNLLRADTPDALGAITDDALSSFTIGPVKTSKFDNQPVRVWSNNYLGMLGREVYAEDSAYDDSGSLHTSEDLVQWLKTQGAKVRG